MDCPTFVADCHVRAGAELLAHTWDPVVLTALRRGPRRRADLIREIGGLSDKVLHESLGRLVSRGLLTHEEGPGSAYRLTTLGESFASGPLRALAEWSAHHAAVLT
ncbi:MULTISPECIES: winged helix-turn-helix transcriptional regulator [Pseudofrankia]|uniref:winged helix-turn-helix transcriptional regulator n=1 Tax=Pseudofrankia TaxID=2994363 RepID=UPI000234C5C9|nr:MULTISPECIES: helix-turn-helix domain-containing protein [Pseudofrankia]